MNAKCRENQGNRSFSRLATMRRLAVLPLALALGAGAAFALASCGGGEDAKLLPGATAAEIDENLDTVKQLSEEGECVGAADAAEQVSAQVRALSEVDPELKRALERGAARLDEVVATCEEVTTETVAPPSEETTTEEEKVPPGQEKKAEREEEEKEEEEEEQMPPPASETPPSETPPGSTPPEEGGGGESGGIGPATPAPEGE